MSDNGMPYTITRTVHHGSHPPKETASSTTVAGALYQLPDSTYDTRGLATIARALSDGNYEHGWCHYEVTVTP